MLNKKEQRKNAHGAATPMSTLLNKQKQYNTSYAKSKIERGTTDER